MNPVPATQERVPASKGVEPESETVKSSPEQGNTPDPLSPESLKLAIQTTLVGQIDPGGFLDAAIALSKLEVKKQPIPLPSGSGAMRYPILGTPDGVTAELWVHGDEPNSQFSSPRLTYHVKLKAGEGDVFEGALRRDPEVQIGLWADKQGGLKQFNVLTDSMISSKSRLAGLGMEGRTLATGVLFQYDPAKPQEWIAQNCGLRNGMPFDSDDRPTLIQGEWPRTDDLKTLQFSLMNQYSTL